MASSQSRQTASVRQTISFSDFHRVLAATDERSVEIAQGCLEPDRVRIQGLVLGKPWTVRREAHEEARKRFIVRCEVECNLVRVSGSAFGCLRTVPGSIPRTTYLYRKLDASPNQSGYLWVG